MKCHIYLDNTKKMDSRSIGVPNCELQNQAATYTVKGKQHENELLANSKTLKGEHRGPKIYQQGQQRGWLCMPSLSFQAGHEKNEKPDVCFLHIWRGKKCSQRNILYFPTSASIWNLFFNPAELLGHSRYPLNTSIYQLYLLGEKLISGIHFKTKKKQTFLD